MRINQSFRQTTKLLWFVFFALFALLISTRTQSSSAQVSSQERNSPVYAHSLDGFREQYGQALDAFKKGDLQKGKELLHGFRLPDPTAWLAQNFAADKIPELLKRYEEAMGNFEASFENSYKDAAQIKHFDLKIEPRPGEPKPFDKPPPNFKPESFSPTQKLQFDRFGFAVQGDGLAPISWEDTFTYYEGTFRFIGRGAYPFWAWEKQHGYRTGLPRQAKLIYSLPPFYPQDAKAKGIEGTVRLQAIIAIDGSVKDIQVISGPPELREAAMNAVRFWRYQPVTIGGKPVEMATTIDIVFQLHNR